MANGQTIVVDSKTDCGLNFGGPRRIHAGKIHRDFFSEYHNQNHKVKGAYRFFV